jgi:multiple sugar transport system substrate-binding protein
VLKAGQIEGKQYLFPTGTFVRLVAYNQDMVAETGAAEPTDDMTWEDYETWLREVQKGLPSGKYATENEGGLMFSFIAWVIGHGQQMYTDDGRLGFDKQLLSDWFQYWLDLTNDGVAVPADKIPDQSLSLELTPLATGLVAAGTRDIPHMYITEQALSKNDLGKAVKSISVPSESTSQSANVLGTNGISIPEDCDNVATAAAWVDFFANNTDAALAFQSDNGILTNTVAQQALLDDPNTPEGVKRNVTTLRGLTESGDLTTTTNPDGASTLTAELLRLYQQVAFGKMTVDEATNAFFTAAEEALS